ncbi:hypothetical protein PFBG_04650 [Plasmodium falciparum 7G8]|uniref:Uncharacterized protein n=2 Tax=Plasmodium falciparum TaxID=5833 RepID=W7K0P5_PLAFO|nr:hypothetical protein PFBG_04650 [Plasmodium falciparum 7G8]EWC86894.1 hypothetical protein PFNF54_04447 [Plasmodium falciparum NF54]
MENNQSIYSAMCIYDHLTVVMKRYNFHLNNMNYGKEHITQLLQNKNQNSKDIDNNDILRNSNTNNESIHMSTDKRVDINPSRQHPLDTKEVNNNSDDIIYKNIRKSFNNTRRYKKYR